MIMKVNQENSSKQHAKEIFLTFHT